MEARMTPHEFFIAAVRREDWTAVKRALELKVSPNTRLDNMDTVAHVAVRKDNAELLSLLMEYKADLTLKNKQQKNVIELAQECNAEKCYQLLTNAGYSLPVRPSVEDRSFLVAAIRAKREAFIDAVKSDRLEEVAKLLDEKLVNINFSIDGEPALHYAVRNRRVGLLDFLIKRKATILTQDKHGLTALEVAIDLANDIVGKGCLDAFLYHPIVDAEINCWQRALLRACKLNNTYAVTVILKHMTNIAKEPHINSPSLEESGHHRAVEKSWGLYRRVLANQPIDIDNERVTEPKPSGEGFFAVPASPPTSSRAPQISLRKYKDE